MKINGQVEACGICHSDAFIKEGLFPGIAFRRVPGLERWNGGIMEYWG